MSDALIDEGSGVGSQESGATEKTSAKEQQPTGAPETIDGKTVQIQTQPAAAGANEIKTAVQSGTQEKKKQEEEDEDGLGWVKEWVELLVRAGMWALIIYLFIFQVSVVEGPSMNPTFLTRDELIIDKLTYRFSSVHRFDVVVFEAIDADKAPIKPRDYIKRVIGTPGDTVEIKAGSVYVNGQALPDTYGPTRVNYSPEPFVYVVPPGYYFVMGDNRDNSKDSRRDTHPGSHSQTLGFVPAGQIKGIVRLRIWPFSRWTWFSRE